MVTAPTSHPTLAPVQPLFAFSSSLFSDENPTHYPPHSPSPLLSSLSLAFLILSDRMIPFAACALTLSAHRHNDTTTVTSPLPPPSYPFTYSRSLSNQRREGGYAMVDTERRKGREDFCVVGVPHCFATYLCEST
jgi:hypothetical protein